MNSNRLYRYLPAMLPAVALLLVKGSSVYHHHHAITLTNNRVLLDRLAHVHGHNIAHVVADVASAMIGIYASDNPPNRGPEVDEIAKIMGHPMHTANGTPWCAKFASAMVLLAEEISGNQIEFRVSGSVSHLWSENQGHIERDDISGVLRRGADLRGALVIREGHVLIAVDHAVTENGVVIDCVSGNTRGPEGPGSVWTNRIEEGDSTWDKLVGLLYPY